MFPLISAVDMKPFKTNITFNPELNHFIRFFALYTNITFIVFITTFVWIAWRWWSVKLFSWLLNKFFFSRQIFIFYTTLDFLRGQLDFLCGVFNGAGISFVAFVNLLIFFEAVFENFLYSCFLYYFFSLFFLFFLLQNT